METSEAAAKFQALSKGTRIDVMPVLAQSGSAGLSAGDMASRLAQPPSTLSFHLSALEQAG